MVSDDNNGEIRMLSFLLLFLTQRVVHLNKISGSYFYPKQQLDQMSWNLRSDWSHPDGKISLLKFSNLRLLFENFYKLYHVDR